jgi:hypothetical protein
VPLAKMEKKNSYNSLLSVELIQQQWTPRVMSGNHLLPNLKKKFSHLVCKLLKNVLLYSHYHLTSVFPPTFEVSYYGQLKLLDNLI